MKSKKSFSQILALLAILGIFIITTTTAVSGDDDLIPGEEMLKNGDFSGPLNFKLYRESGGNAGLSIINEELEIDVTNVGRVTHAIQPYYDGFKLFEGVEYELSFDAQATIDRDVFVRIQLNGGDYHAYFEQQIDLIPEPKHFSFSFVMEESSDPAPRLCINMGYTDKMSAAGLSPDDIEAHKVYFDNFSLSIRDASGVVLDDQGTKINPIRLNQVGYLPGSQKTAVFADVDADTFSVIKRSTGETIMTGTLSAPVENPYANETDRIADFSALTTPGAYMLVASDGTASPAFAVSKEVYSRLLRNTLRMLYLQRCGTELSSKDAGVFAHPACHTDLALVYGTDQWIDVSGGWHDAGDYGRYIVSGAKAAADLLLSYEMNNALLDDAGIPESGDGVDDRLQEARYELDWMLKMQADNGGVYHKVSGYNFPGFIKPQEETDILIAAPISITATSDFAAVMALGARIFTESGDAALIFTADKYLSAAERAWEYLEAHPEGNGFVNPPDILTGEYGDNKSTDERFWASAELARATGKTEYQKTAADLLLSGEITAEFGWADMGGYGLYALLTDPLTDDSGPAYKTAMDLLTIRIREVTAGINNNPYAVNRTNNYEWGSNMGIANDGILLIIGSSILGDGSLNNAANRQLDYLLGENATGYCFVTGMGTLSPSHPHHRPSMAFGSAMPGMLIGGPDSALEDTYMLSAMADCDPAKCYADSDQSYSTNEVTVYWNSPLILLTSAIISSSR